MIRIDAIFVGIGPNSIRGLEIRVSAKTALMS